MSTDLFSPVSMGDITLTNRMVMAPLTRNRADEHNAPHGINVTHLRYSLALPDLE